ncbi:MAG: DegT/DnrJ/EryC1/StrS family aminotransferase, partial [Actinomycetota bacterium]
RRAVNVPLFDAQREFEVHGDEYRAAAERVLGSGRYILGPEVEAFEREAASFLGANHAVGCASGTDALWLALRAAGIGPGDGVITTAVTFFATAGAILNVGATPILCDVDPTTLNIEPESVGAVLADRSEVHRRIGVDPERIKAIIPVHLYGRPADMDPLLELARVHGLRVVEDAAQSFGANYHGRATGTIGDLGCFSFFPTKTLGAFGDGGMVTTDDDDIAARLRKLRNHGGTSKFENLVVGTNSRLDALQAALLRVRLAHVAEALEGRRRVAAAYDEQLAGAGIGLPARAPDRDHVFLFYVVRVPDRDAVIESLARDGVAALAHNPSPVHLQPAVGLGYRPGDLPNAEAACAEVLSLPMFPHMRTDEISHVAGALVAAVRARTVPAL